MNFLLDHDTPDNIVYSLQKLGHQIELLRDALPVDASDAEVFAHAQEEGRKDRHYMQSR
ncbi:MAG: DUF5615 family PIN-like protein [Verrucomicrobia bacterium]|nr:DUF5615 family PIN-like protein [Verrucomicrobiota bacterium]